MRESILRDGDVLGFGRGSQVREGEVIQERHLEYMFVVRMLKLRGGRPRGPDKRVVGAASSLGGQQQLANPHKKTPGQICLPCRSHLFPPSRVDPQRVGPSFVAPADLKLEWLHGYRCARGIVLKDKLMPGRSENLHNAKFLTKNIVAFPVACCVVLFNVDGYTQEHFQGHDDDVLQIAVHPDRNKMASAQVASLQHLSPPIHIWDTKTKKILRTLQGFHRRKVTLLEFNPTGQYLLTVGGDDRHSVAVFDWIAQATLFTANGHVEEVYDIRHNPLDPFEFTQVGNKHVKFWTYRDEEGKIGGTRQTRNFSRDWKQAEPQIVACVTYSAEGLPVVGLEDGHIFFYGRGKPSAVQDKGMLEVHDRIHNAHSGQVIALCDHKSGIVSSGRDGFVKVWAPSSGNSARGSQRGESRTGSVAWSAKYRIDLRTLGMDGMEGKIVGSALDHMDGELLVGTSVGSLFVFHLAEGPAALERPEKLVLGHCGASTGCDVSPSCAPYFVTVSLDGTLRRWSLTAHSLLQSVHVGLPSTSVAISPDESLIAIGHTAGRFSVWDWPAPIRNRETTPRCILKNSQRFEDVCDIKWSPGGRYLAVACREQVIDIYDALQDFRRVGTCKGHSGAVLHIDFSADGNFLRSDCAAAELLHWEVPSGRQFPRVVEHRDLAWATNNVIFGCPLAQALSPN